MTIADSGTFRIADRVVHRLGFGAMRITGKGIWGEPPDRDRALRVLRRSRELGIDLIDTANSYGPMISEQLIAEALHPYEEDLTIATKAGLARSGPNKWHADCRPGSLKHECEGSLKRLRLEQIPLFQLHTVDRKVPYQESVGALKELQEEGKIAHIGVSNVSVDQLEQAREIVEVHTVQNRFNLTDRGHEEVLEHCERQGIGFIPYFPLAAGRLAAPGEPVDEAARRHDATPGQVALAWLLQRSDVMLPIPGTGSPEHLEENAAAGGLRLDEDELSRLEQAA